jgi:hypothetical protein
VDVFDQEAFPLDSKSIIQQESDGNIHIYKGMTKPATNESALKMFLAFLKLVCLK